jgi:flagellar basal-body rod modification protein FlgD
MSVQAVNSSSNPANSPQTSAASNDMSDIFMKLLVAQLKSQSPLDPVDPTQFVGQLAQFNTLGQIIKIRELLEQAGASAGPAQS